MLVVPPTTHPNGTRMGNDETIFDFGRLPREKIRSSLLRIREICLPDSLVAVHCKISR